MTTVLANENIDLVARSGRKPRKPAKQKKRVFDPANLNAAMVAAGFANANQLLQRLPGVSRQRAYDWCAGTNVPSGEYLVQLCELLGRSSQYLLGAAETVDDILRRVERELRNAGAIDEANAIVSMRSMRTPKITEPFVHDLDKIGKVRAEAKISATSPSARGER